MDLYVSLQGRDSWSGRRAAPNGSQTDGPFATLDRARDEVRHMRASGHPPHGATIHVRGGLYEIKTPLSLDARDSGAEGAPIVYRAYRDEKVTLSGGRRIGGWKPVSDPAIMDRLPEKARGHVWQADVRASGVTDLGQVAAPGEQLELFFEDRPMTLARWPNEGFVKIAETLGGKPIESNGIKGDAAGRFRYEGDEPGRWAQEPDIWLHGYWFWDWSDEYEKVKSIDAASRTIELAPPYHTYGYRAGQRYYALNLLSELDSPGEWYLDRGSGTLYFWPPGDLEKGRPTLSVLPALITVQGASWVTLRGLGLATTRGTAAAISGGEHDRIEGCLIRNTGGWGVRIEGGSHSGIEDSEVYGTGEGGISLSGGDRKTLTPSGHYAEDNHIHGFGRIYRTYRPGVGVDGVGVRVAHNLIHDGPHNGILLGGNDHLIEYNEIHHVCYETGDVGAFYMGRDWTARGTVIRYNYFHDIRGPGLYGAMAVYLDDAASGIMVFGNVFYRAGRASFIGGGRDNTVENNIFVECDPSVHVDARGLNWMRYHVEKGGTLPTRLAEMPYQRPPWSTRYPRLVDILADDPGAPKGNVIARNISVGGQWLDVEKDAEPFIHPTDNWVDKDPRFVDAAHQHYQLKADSPAWKIGFQRIPIEKIGLTGKLKAGG